MACRKAAAKITSSVTMRAAQTATRCGASKARRTRAGATRHGPHCAPRRPAQPARRRLTHPAAPLARAGAAPIARHGGRVGVPRSRAPGAACGSAPGARALGAALPASARGVCRGNGLQTPAPCAQERRAGCAWCGGAQARAVVVALYYAASATAAPPAAAARSAGVAPAHRSVVTSTQREMWNMKTLHTQADWQFPAKESIRQARACTRGSQAWKESSDNTRGKTMC